MGFIYGTEGNDLILRDSLSDGVTTDPEGLTGTDPGHHYDQIFGYGGDDVIEFGSHSDFAFGGEGNDLIDASHGNGPIFVFIVLIGGPGEDWLIGSNGQDWLDANPEGNTDDASGADWLMGGAGSDFYYVDNYGDRVFERAGEGRDEIFTSLNFHRLPRNFEDLTIITDDETPGFGIGNAADNIIKMLFGGGAWGREGNDQIFFAGGAFTANGGAGHDELVAYDPYGDGHFRPYRDILRGQNGNDRLTGDAGGDCLIGGRGRDFFVFQFTTDSFGQHRDVIKSGDGAATFEGAGRSKGDVFDLSFLDADDTREDLQSFEFGGTGKGQLSLVDRGRSTILRGNTDDDDGFEFCVVIRDGQTRAGDYLVDDFIL